MVCLRNVRPSFARRISILAVATVVAIFLLVMQATSSAAQDRTYPRPTGYVNDFAGVLDPAVKARIENLLSRVDQQLEVQFAIAVTKDLGDEDPTDYANRLFEAWKVGNKKTSRGVLLLDVVGDGPGRSFFRVEVGYGLEGVLPDGRVGAILDQDVIPYLKQGRRDLAYVSAVRSLSRPILEEMGRSPDLIDSLLAEGGYPVRRRSTGGRDPASLLPILIFIIFSIIAGFGRRGRRNRWSGIGPWGGFGGFGGFGGGGGGFGGGGGGFGGFGGGSSGGGGAGRGY